MATTSPDNIRTPDPSDPYNLVPDLAQMAGDVQTALIQRANSYKGTSTQRTAFTAAAENGAIWQDTNTPYRIWRKQGGSGGSWQPLVPFEDTGWVNVPLLSGYTGSAAYRAVGSIVSFRFAISGDFSSTGSVPLTSGLPSAHRPAEDIVRVPALEMSPTTSRTSSVPFGFNSGAFTKLGMPAVSIPPTQVRGQYNWMTSS